tara:strand:+ start:58 stop:540 length:483 start_codon:yes stop_codon:yes gene_type:complete
MYGGGRDAGKGSGFGNENFGENQGKNNYKVTPKAKTKLQKTYSILANIAQGFSQMVTVGRQQNADVKAGLRDPADFSFPGNDGDGGNNSNVAVPLISNLLTRTTGTAPTTAEVSQSTATSADGYDLRKTKARGRSMTILTGSKGVKNNTLTLGRKSLLGQ